jgi:flagella basal body P-ring formation protein FlgA
MRWIGCFVLVVFRAVACTTVEGERIVAGDVARAVPAFLSVAPETDLGPSPSPGVRRVLTRPQLSRMALEKGIRPVDLPDSLCVERLQMALEAGAVLLAIESSAREIFPGQEIRVELLDHFRHPLPPGSLRFRRQGVIGGVGKGFDAPLVWRGSLITDTKRSMPVWAKAKVLVRRLCWSAKSALPAGVVPVEEQFAHQELWVNPFLGSTDCADLKARNVRLRSALRAGQLLTRSDLAMIPPVRRGDRVQASLTMASAKLSFDAVAEMDGVEGQSVLIKRDGRRLRARVSGAGAVQVLSKDTQ